MGKIKGAGPRINREYPKAVPLWCASHQLNRVIVQSCTEPPVRNMIGTVDNVSLKNIEMKFQILKIYIIYIYTFDTFFRQYGSLSSLHREQVFYLQLLMKVIPKIGS